MFKPTKWNSLEKVWLSSKFLSLPIWLWYTFEKNHLLNNIYHIYKLLQSCGWKSFNNTENPSATGGLLRSSPPTRALPWTRWGSKAVPSRLPRPLAKFPPTTKLFFKSALVGPGFSQTDTFLVSETHIMLLLW